MARSRRHDGGSSKTIYAAIASNVGIAITKLIAALFTGSSSMLAEGIHSFIDTANEGFLLLGLHRAKKPANARHPFGYGVEVYFWAFIVAILIFGLGAGFSVFEGVEGLLTEEPSAIEAPIVALVVLGLAFCFEGYSWSVAFREFQKRRNGEGLIADFRDLKDPSVFVVLFEDSAACVGVLIAAVCVGLSWATGNPVFDPIGSILIGILLAATATFLAIEVKGLIIGEAASNKIETAVRRAMERHAEIIAINELRTLHLGPNDVLLTASCDFRDNVLSQDVEAAVSELEAEVKAKFPIIRRLYIEVQSREAHRRMELAEANLD
ncbi:cation diffusion facilitator family transporter [Consotaella aegiceratis]|uniref:cation diffusion facilitator family transporter n=1 Tax=Consotaella aegiceratis TaxID=3097961 RepID=UPI002F420387